MGRPGWVMAVYAFLGDGIIDHASYPEDGSDDAVLDAVQAAAYAVLCERYGHEIIPDLCGKPEHDFCVYCGRLASVLTPQGEQP